MRKIRVIDFETTGLEPPAQVCEVGTCDVGVDEATRSTVIGEPASWTCGVEIMPPEARAIHHIALEECDGKAPFAEGGLFSNVEIIAAHNADFELKFIICPLPVICTYRAALRVWPEAPSHSNGALRYWLEDQEKIWPVHSRTQPAHRAGPDAYTTAHLLVALLADGASLDEMIAWACEPRVLPTCPIGKFRGMPWAEVEPGFLGWMLRQPAMEADLKWNAEREIARRAGRN